jgi:hypothetical protein
MSKERFQNPTCGDTVNLRLFTFNSNSRSNVKEITEVKIYFLDPTQRTDVNPSGATLVETISAPSVQNTATGEYLIELYLDTSTYQVGVYQDVWSIVFQDGECASGNITNEFQVYSQLWFTTPTPPIYDFNFNFRPNRVSKGSKRYILIQITPNVPKGADILPYYENLAVNADIRVSMEMACGECLPQEQDLRLVVDRQVVDYRERGYGYYFLDTTQFDEGIYNIWFEVNLGESTFVSEKNALQIFS